MSGPSVRSVALLCVVAVVLGFSPPPALAGVEEALSADYDPRTTKVLRSLAGAADVSVAETPDVGGTPGGSSEIPGSPFAGTLAAGTDDVDVYWIDLADSDRIGLTITGDAALNADVYLYAPGTTDIAATGALVGTTGDAFVKSVTHRAGVTGRYYVAVAAAAGAGSYTLSWYRSPWNADADSEIPGVSRTSPHAGSVDASSDPDDVLPVAVAEGQRLTVSLDSWSSALAPQLYLFGPGAGSILTATPLAASAPGPVRSFSFDVPTGSGKAGTYYVDVKAASGSGDYTLSWGLETLSAGTWKNVGDAIALPASPASAALQPSTAANVVYRIALSAGQRFDARLVSPAGADFDVYVYPSGTANLFATSPIAWADDFVGDDKVVFDAQVAGTYYVEVRRFAGDGTFVLHWALGLTPTLGAAERVWGVDRYLTAIETSKATFSAASCPTVVIATGADFPDALAASGLAGAYGSPVLLTPTGALPGGLVTELNRLGATKVVIVGGPVAVSTNAENQLKAAGFGTSRAQGLTRYETAADVARKIRAITGARADSPAFVVRGDLFPDALAAAPIAYRGAFPVLLTQSTVLTPATRAVITEIGVNEIVIAGGPAAVSVPVESALRSVTGVRTVHREQGGNRYETAANVARYGVRMWWASNENIGLATGEDFPDALGGGAAIGKRGGVVLLSTPASLAPPTSAYLSTYGSDVTDVQVFGGTQALSDIVKAQLEAALH